MKTTCLKSTVGMIACLLSLNLYCQEANVIPPSPNVASLGKYGDIPVAFARRTGFLGLPGPDSNSLF